MEAANPHILTINAGSSSIKFDLFDVDSPRKRVLQGAIEKIGWPDGTFFIKSADGQHDMKQPVLAADHVAALAIVTNWLKSNLAGQQVVLIGHRIVHGGPKYFSAQLVDDQLLTDLKQLVALDPEHLPMQINLIETLRSMFPGVKQAASFDTGFHHELPAKARLLPLPRHFEQSGLRRYGFHGLSCTYVLSELEDQAGGQIANGRVIIAHLGSGVSLTAISGGKSVETTMSLTPASGVPMSTRTGDIDPGLVAYLATTANMDASQFNELVNFKSGLLGLSGTTGDMKKLLAAEASDPAARQAVELFCYQIKKAIGSLSAALGGVDALVFTGGMGEQAPKVRAEICQGLEYLGIRLDEDANAQNANVISAADGRVVVRVIQTDEAAVIASQVSQFMEGGSSESAQQLS